MFTCTVFRQMADFFVQIAIHVELAHDLPNAT